MAGRNWLSVLACRVVFVAFVAFTIHLTSRQLPDHLLRTSVFSFNYLNSSLDKHEPFIHIIFQRHFVCTTTYILSQSSPPQNSPMPSTRESSPMGEVGSPSTPQLTPNSKVQAMLNIFNNDSDNSDEESVSGDARARLLKAMNTSKASNSDKEKDTMEETQNDISTTEEDSDEQEIVRPRGRIAGAMRAQNSSSNKSTPTRKRTDEILTPKQNAIKQTSASDESDVPAISRRRKIRVSRHSTPEPSLQDELASPGLFVSPNALNTYTPADASDSEDLPEAMDSDTRFKALVERKQKEMQAKTQAAQELRQKKEAELQRYSDALDEDNLVGSDEEGGRRLTQQMKPTRKASKRALEEMHRETQRLSRNQQLAHYATTKKKFTTKDFVKSFDRKVEMTPELPSQHDTEPTSSSPARGSDADLGGTPSTSPPPSAEDDHHQKLPNLPSHVVDDNADDLPTLEEVIPSSPPARKDKGKGRAIEEVIPELKKPKDPVFKHRPIRVRPPPIQDRKVSPLDDSDSDLEIISVKPTIKTRIAEVFDRVPAQKGAGNHHALRLLAHLGSPGKQNTGRNKKPSMTTSEMQTSLQQRARQQAAHEREERLQAARDRGVIIQTAEERQQEMAEVEDLLSKARREGDEITKREKAAAKKERKESGEADPLGGSSDDEDWVEEKSKNLIEEENSGSGSEAGVDESESEDDASGEEEGDEMELDGNVQKVANPLFDDEASATDDNEAEAEADLSMDEMAEDKSNDEDEEDLPNIQQNRRMRNANVISDEEDESQDEQQTPSIAKFVSPNQFNINSPVAPTSVLRSATKTFIPGVSVTGAVGLGLTQIFAGTMDDSQFSPSPADGGFQQNNVEKDALAFLRRIPAPELPAFMPTMEENTQAYPDSPSQMSHIPESQPMEDDTQELDLNFTQSQIHGSDSLVEDSQMSPFPEATQDVGFAEMTPIKGRFVDSPATAMTRVMDPLVMPESVEETPVVKRKGRLHRRAPVVFSDDEDAAEPIDLGDDFEINESIFDVMRKAAKPKKVVADEFNKKKSGAKEMVNEQADESEDEYAGLGGASDDESGGEADEYVKAMIDDEGGQNVDKNQIAAFYA